jgi:hypothetical protein
MGAPSRRDAPSSPAAEPGLALADAAQSPTARGRAESPIGGPRRGEEQDIAAGPMAGPAVTRFGDFAWALAHAGADGDTGRIDGGGRLGRGGTRRRPDRRRGRIGLREGGTLAGPAAIASGLVAATLSAVAGGAVASSGQPAAPAACGGLADGATVAGLGAARQEPALATLEQAAAAAGMPATGSGSLTRDQGVGRLGTAHGRDMLPSGQAAGRWHFPPPLCADRRADGGRHRSDRHPSDYGRGRCLPRRQGPGRRESQSRDRPIADWLNWLCENGSVFGRC